jgi:hypothetical protein
MITGPDGEYAVDQSRSLMIAPVDTWGKLSTNELIKTKTQLVDMFYQLRDNPNSVRILTNRISLIDEMISASRNKNR